MAPELGPRAAALLDALPGNGPAVLARAPGRVNLIGEHTDYNGLPVLPIAIDRDVLVAARRRDDDRVELANADPAFAPRRYRVGPAIPSSPPGDWANYHKAAGQALRIDFFPLRARPVPIPPHAAFVVAHSLEGAEKSGAARGHYNQRVTECALACAVLARRLGTAAARLGDLSAPETLLADLDRLLPEEATRAALPALTGLAADALGRRFFPAGTTLADPARFRLRARARHVLGEAARVAAAEHALRAGDLGALGALMDASHQSCAEDFGVSTPALDRLVAVARAGGARGARLTGAGFGGAIVALAERADTERVTEALDRDFYAARGATPGPWLVVRPAAGASLERV